MNKIYKVIFNRNKNRYEIVSELASSRGGKCKVKAGKQIAKLFMTGLLATFLSSVALAADQDVKVKYDAATGTIKIFNADGSQELASYAVGGNISSIDSLGTDPKTSETIYPSGVIAIGKDSKAVQSNNIAIGTDAHAGDVGGSDDTNGRIAIGTETVASGNRSIALGNKSSTNNGSYNIAQGNDAISIGTSTSVFGNSGVSIGRRNIIGVPDPDLVNNNDGVLTTKSKTKYGENDPGGNSVIVGAYNVAYGNRSNVIGTYSRAMGSNSVAIGSGVQSLTDGAIAIGKGSGYEFSNKITTYARYWELPPEYKVLKQVLKTDIQGDKEYNKGRKTLPKYENYGAGSSDPGGFIVEGKNALGVGSYTQVRGDSAIGLATGEMTADLSLKDKSAYAMAMGQIMGMEEALYEAKEELEKLKAEAGDTTEAESAVKAAEERLATAKEEFRTNYLSEYSFVEGEAALGVGRKILAQGDRSMAVGDQAKALSHDAIAYGGKTLANGTNSMAMGGNAHVGTEGTEGTEGKSFNNSMAIGSHTNVQAGNAVALGAFSQVTGENSLALGFGKQDGNNINYNAVSGKDSTLIGSYGTVQGNNSILIGSSGSIANDRVVALGNNINIAAANSDDQENNTAGSVFLGDHAGYVTDSKRARSLGKVDVVGSNEKMELTESLSSTKGALRDYTKDFIYIYMLEKQDDGTQIGAPIAVRSDFAGGDSTVGVVSVGSTYEQNFKNIDEIREYHTKVGSLITVPVDVEVEVTKNGIKLGKQNQIRYFAADSTQEEIYADSTLSQADKEKVWKEIQSKTSTPNNTYTVFETRRIQNVAPGLIGVNSTDAINGSQLFATNQMLGNLVGSLKKTFGDNVTITPDGQIGPKDKDTPFTLGWIAKAGSVEGSNGTVAYEVDRAEGETNEANKEKVDKLQSTGYVVDAAKTMTFKAGKNIGLVQKPGELSISTVDTPRFTSVELRGNETTTDDGKKVTEVTKIDSSGMKVVTETSTPASDGSTTPTVTEKVSTTVGKDGVSTDGSVKVTNGTTDLVTIDKGTDGSGTDQEYGKIGLDGKNGSSATITVDRGTSSLDDTKNIGGTDPKQDISENNPAKMDRITYTTKSKDGNDVITHEVATMDDGLFFSGDSADGENNNVKNKFDRKLSQETKIIGGVNLGLQADATAKQRQEAITAKLTDGNIGVISDGTDTLTVKLAKQLTGLDSTTYTSPTTKTDDGDDATSTMKVDGNGVRFVGDNDTVKNDAPSLTTDGIDGGNKQITNIDSGLKNGNTTISISDLKDPNKTATINPILNNAVNVSDLKTIVDAGFKLNTSGQPTDSGATTVKIGETINVVNGVNTKVSAIDDSTTGTHTFHIDVTGMPISYTDNQGNALTKIGDKYYKNTDIENGKPKTNAKDVPADEVTNNIKVIDKDGTTNNQGTISNVKSAIDGTVGNGAPNGSTINDEAGTNTFIDNVNRIGANTNGIDKNSVVTTGDLKNLADTPLFFSGDSADGVANENGADKNTFARKLSQETKIVGGVDLGLQNGATADERKKAIAEKLTDGNIGVISDGSDTLTIKLAKELVNLTSVETGSGDNKTKMTENGVTTTVKDGDTFKVTTTTPNGLATTEVKLDSDDKPTGESTTTMVTTDGVTITTQTPQNGDKPASTTETKLSKDGLATDGTIMVTGDNAKDLVTIAKGTETDPNATDKEFGTVAIDGKNGSNATLTVDRGTKSVTDKANILKDPKQPAEDNNPVSMDRLTYTTTGADGKSIIKHEVATLDDGFFLTTEHTEEDKTRTVLFNHTIKVLDGANTKVSAMGGEDGTHTFSIDVTGLPMTYTATDANGKTQDVHKVGDTYTLADGTKLVQVGDKFYKPNQVEEVNGTPQVKADQEDKDTKLNNISLTSPVANTAPTLSNVGSALKKSDGTRITMSDLDDGNVYPTEHPIWNNAVNVGDLKAATDAARTEVTGTGKAIVTKKTGDKGKNIYNVHVDPVVDVVATDGKTPVVRGDDGKYYNPTDIADKTFVSDGKGGGSWYNDDDVVNGVPTENATPQVVTPADVKNSFVNPNSNESIVVDNVKSGIGGEVGDPSKNKPNTFLENVNKVGATNGISENVVVNAKDLKNLVDTGFKLNTSGQPTNSGATTVKIGDTINIIDGANTKVSAIDDSTTGTHTFHIDVTGLPVTYTATETDGEGKPTGTPVDVTKTKDGYQKADGTPLIKINENGKDVYYTADQLDNNVPKPGAKGLTITDNIRLINPKDGTGATKITNVAAGTDDTDAVNVSQLKQKVAAATTEVTGTGKAIVTSKQAQDGHTIYNVHVDPIVDVVGADGSEVVRGDDGKYYKPSDIANKTYILNADGNGGNWYDNGDLTNGVPKPGAQPQNVTPTDVKNNFVNPNGTGSIVLDNVKSGIGGKVVDPEHENKNTFMKNVNTIGDTNGISENTVVNAGDLKNLVDTGFKLNTSGHSGDAQTVKIGETIKVVDGANTKVSDITPKDGVYEFHIDVTGLPMTYTVSQTGGTDAPVSVSKVGDTYQLADGTKLVKVDDKFYKPSQLVDPDADKPQVKPEEVAKDWTVNDSISLVNKDGSNNAPTLKNVGSGLKDANGNSTTLDQAVGSNAVNVDDLRTLGKAATTEVTGTGAAEVTKVTGANGQNIYNVHVDKLMEAKSTEPGKTIVRGSDNKYYYVDALKQANDGKWYPADQVGADGKPADGAVGKDTTELTVVPADKLKNSLVNPNGEGPTVLDNVKSGIGGKVDDPDSNHENTFMKKVDTIGKANGISENTVVNAGDLKNLVDTGFKLNTSGHSGEAKTVKIGETIKVVDGANTKVSDITSTKGGVHEFHIDVTGLPVTYTAKEGENGQPVDVSKVGDTYQLADGTKLVKYGNKFYKPNQIVNGQPVGDAQGFTINDDIRLVNPNNGTGPVKITNVAPGVGDNDAVNMSQLKTLSAGSKTEVTGTGAAEVTKTTGANGQNVYNVHVERFMQVAETDVEGNKVVKAADNHYYKEADIKGKTYIDGQWYNNTDIKDKTKIGDKWYNNTEITDGKANPDATELTVQATTAPNKAVGLQNNLVNPNDNTPTRLSNLASALSGEVGNGANTEDNSAINGIDKNGKPTSESGNNTFVKNVLDLDATVKTEEQLKTSLRHDPSEDEVKAEKARAEKDKALLNSAVTVADLQKTLQSPLFFEGDSADGVANENGSDKNTFARKLSQKTKIVGGVDLGLKENATADERQKAIADKLTDGNIGVVSNGTNTLTIKLAKNLVNLTSVETGSGNNKTKMTENGITTTVKDGDTFKVTTTTPNGLATTEVKLDSEGMPKGESTTTMVTTDGVTITTQTPKNGDKPASTTETKLSKGGLTTDGTIKVTGDNAKDLVTIGKGTETDQNATDKEFGTVAIDGKNGSNATLTVDRGTKSVTDSANVGKDPTKPIDKNNPVAGMDRLTYTTTGPNNETINHEVATLDDGFFLTTEHTEADKTRTVLFNNTIKVLDGANTKVSAMGGEKGTHTFSIDVTGLPVTYTATKTDANGAPTGEPVDVSKVGDGYQLADGTKLEKAGDKYYTPDQLENGQPKPDAEGLTIKQSVSLVQDNGAPATLERVGSGRRNGMNAKDTPMDWNSILNAAADNTEVNNMLTNAANIGDVRDAIKSITNGTDDNAIGGFGLTGNNGEVKQDLGKTITVKGGIANKKDDSDKDLGQPAKSTTDKNTYVNVKDVPNADGKGSHKEMVIEIAKDLTDLDSVTVGSVDPTTGKGETTKITGKDVTIKDKAGNTNTSTATKDELTNANGDKTTVEAGKVDVSKKNADGTTSNTNIDGSKITLENKDKDSNTVGSKTDIGTDGIRITYKDKDGNTDSKKDVSLTDKGLNNGGNQIKNVGSGLVNKDGSKITDIAGITDQDILSNGVNVGDLQKAINSVTNSSNGGGFGLKGNNGKIMQDLGKTITVKGGIANKVDEAGQDLHVPEKSTTDQNTYVNVKDSEMVVEIAKDLIDLDSVTIGNVDKKGNGGTVINKDGMTVKDATGNNSTSIGTGTIGTSKTDGNGNTSSTNIDGSTITLENKDKDGKLTGPKTEVSNKGITITPVDEDGKPIEGKKVELSDTGLDNGGNQIKHVDSGLKKENGDSVKLEDATGDMLNNAVNVGDLQSVNKKLKDDIINISNQVDDIKNSAPVVYVYTNEKGERKRVSKQGDKFVDEDGNPVKPHEIKLSLVNVDGKPSTLQNVAKGVNKTDAVNVEQLEEATEKPLTFNGDTGSSSAKLGETVAIKGGANSADLTDNNIGVIANSSTKTLNVKLSKKLKGLESAEFVDNNGNTTNITGDGVHISGGNGSNVSLTSQGLNNGGNRITNVAPGVEATDAVNVSQLNQVGAALHNRINNVAKGAYGGVASAGAMASLPQAYLPGKSMVAAGASHYRGESAVALGASRISDNGKIILKLNASHNTSGNTMVGAGVGYQF